MNIKGTTYQISYNRSGEFWWRDSSDGSSEWKIASSQIEFDLCKNLYNLAKVYRFDSSSSDVIDSADTIIAELKRLSELKESGSEEYSESLFADYVETSKNIIDFFSEFSFEPNFRFVNTFAFCCKTSQEDGVKFIRNYFELIDSPHTNSISEKMKSPEFKFICNSLSRAPVSERINQRFKLYYGSQGTGKTTKALEESEGSCMVCHSAILPQDLMEDFKFVDGKAEFSPSALQVAMIEGRKIVLDEINLLPFESLRFLQSILDGKEKFLYKNKEIKISKGFMIIGTMNLVVNGCTYALPEPLVDRAQELKKVTITPELLALSLWKSKNETSETI